MRITVFYLHFGKLSGGGGLGLRGNALKIFPFRTMGNVSRLAFSCRASNFQEGITNVKRVMAALSFKKCFVYSQCEI
jgi:hypothetical protein